MEQHYYYDRTHTYNQASTHTCQLTNTHACTKFDLACSLHLYQRKCKRNESKEEEEMLEIENNGGGTKHWSALLYSGLSFFLLIPTTRHQQYIYL